MTFLGIADTAAAVPQVVLPRVEPDIVEGLWQRVVDGLWQEEGDEGADHGQEEGEEQQVVLAPAPAHRGYNQDYTTTLFIKKLIRFSIQS